MPAAPSGARRRSGACDHDTVICGDDFDRLDVRYVKVTAQNEINPDDSCQFEGNTSILSDIMRPQRLNLRQVMMYDEDLENTHI